MSFTHTHRSHTTKQTAHKHARNPHNNTTPHTKTLTHTHTPTHNKADCTRARTQFSTQHIPTHKNTHTRTHTRAHTHAHTHKHTHTHRHTHTRTHTHRISEMAHVAASEGDGIGCMLAGDYNSTPGSPLYEFMQNGILHLNMYDKQTLSGACEANKPTQVFAERYPPPQHVRQAHTIRCA